MFWLQSWRHIIEGQTSVETRAVRAGPKCCVENWEVWTGLLTSVGTRWFSPFCLQPLEFKPVPLLKDDDYLVEWKKEYRNAMKDSPYFITMPEAKTDIERYSDKYQMNGQDNNNVMEPGT